MLSDEAQAPAGNLSLQQPAGSPSPTSPGLDASFPTCRGHTLTQNAHARGSLCIPVSPEALPLPQLPGGRPLGPSALASASVPQGCLVASSSPANPELSMFTVVPSSCELGASARRSESSNAYENHRVNPRAGPSPQSPTGLAHHQLPRLQQETEPLRDLRSQRQQPVKM